MTSGEIASPSTKLTVSWQEPAEDFSDGFLFLQLIDVAEFVQVKEL
jgi:hypothetical protein